MTNDTNFDQHKQRFKHNIYNRPKGQIRLQLLQQDLQSALTSYLLPTENNQPLTILDAGCGMGQISLDLAKQGHHLTLCDISDELLQTAASSFAEAGYQAQFINQSFQTLDQQHDQQYDLILSHAVLEWLHEPEQGIAQLKQRLKPGGYLSLMFYNRNSIALYNLLKGNFRKVARQDFKGHPGGLTPTNPIDPEALDKWLENNQLDVLQKSGIRVIYDYLSADLKKNRSFEDIMEMEQLYFQKPPFNMLGRYIHYFCQLTT